MTQVHLISPTPYIFFAVKIFQREEIYYVIFTHAENFPHAENFVQQKSRRKYSR